METLSYQNVTSSSSYPFILLSSLNFEEIFPSFIYCLDFEKMIMFYFNSNNKSLFLKHFKFSLFHTVCFIQGKRRKNFHALEGSRPNSISSGQGRS